MSDQNSPSPDPSDAVPGYTPSNEPPAPGSYPPPPPPGAYPPPPPQAPPPGYPAAPVPGQINIGEALSYGWRKFSAAPLPFILVLLISAGASTVIWLVGITILGVVAAASTDSYGYASGGVLLVAILGIVIFALVMFVALVVNMGLTRASIDTVRGAPVSVGSAFRMDDFVQYLALEGILVGAYLVLSVVLSFVPFLGSIVSFLVTLAAGVLMFFAPYLVLDKKMSAIEAIKASYAMAMSNIGQVILVVLVVGLVAAAGAIVCGIGAFVTVPLAMIAGAYCYLALQGEIAAP